MHVADPTLTVVRVITLVHNDRLKGGYVSYYVGKAMIGLDKAWGLGKCSIRLASLSIHTYGGTEYSVLVSELGT